MKKAFLLLALSAFFGTAFAGESCEQMQTRIVEKIKANGVKNPTVVIAKKSDAVPEKAKVVGNCGHGTMVVLYSK